MDATGICGPMTLTSHVGTQHGRLGPPGLDFVDGRGARETVGRECSGCAMQERVNDFGLAEGKGKERRVSHSPGPILRARLTLIGGARPFRRPVVM